MGYWDSFDCQVQCEEVYTGEGLRAQLTWGDYMAMEDAEQKLRESMDVLGSGMCVSLEAMGQAVQNIGYKMEEAVIEAEEFDRLWDSNQAHEELDSQFRLRAIGA